MKTTVIIINCVISILLIAGLSAGQNNVVTPDLSKITRQDGWKIFNRNADLLEKIGTTVVHLDGRPGDGFVWLEGFEFNNGTIEVDLKGKDLQGNNFVGIAFRGVDEKTYDVVYFRPFNFVSSDSIRRNHSVQYISHPIYTWEKLRSDSPGKYESRIDPPPDPDGFFHARIVVSKPKISVYVNNNEKPCLVVNELSERTGGLIGLWAGNYSDGSFMNLKIEGRQK